MKQKSLPYGAYRIMNQGLREAGVNHSKRVRDNTEGKIAECRGWNRGRLDAKFLGGIPDHLGGGPIPSAVRASRKGVMLWCDSAGAPPAPQGAFAPQAQGAFAPQVQASPEVLLVVLPDRPR